MPNGHYWSAGANIPFGDASALFPVTELDATVHQRRDAELALADVDGADVVAIGPTGLGSSYLITQHTLTAIPVETLSAAVAARLDDALDVPLERFELIQVGKWVDDSENHSLSEFTEA